MASLWNRPGFSVSRIKMARLSAAKARVSQRRVYEQRSVWQRVARSWQLIRVIWNAVGKIVLQLAGLLAFALIGVLSVENSHTEDDCDRADIRPKDVGGKRLLGRSRGTAVARCSE